jgi:hypothetical protein
MIRTCERNNKRRDLAVRSRKKGRGLLTGVLERAWRCRKYQRMPVSATARRMLTDDATRPSASSSCGGGAMAEVRGEGAAAGGIEWRRGRLKRPRRGLAWGGEGPAEE